MKKCLCLLAALLLLAVPTLPASPGDTENRYDLLGRVLAPIAAVFVATDDGQPRALDAELVLSEMTGLPAEFENARIRVAIESPDKCLVQGLLLSGTDTPAAITICREGQRVWVHPGGLAQRLAAQAGKLSKKQRTARRLDNFALPFPAQQLAFLPAFFEVEEAGTAMVGNTACRLLGVRLMPELAQSMKLEEWQAQLAVRPDATPARLELARPGWRMAVEIVTLNFGRSLPQETWQPTPAEAADMLHLDALECQRLLHALDRRFRGTRTR